MTVALIDEAIFADRIGKDVGEHGQPDGKGPNQKAIAKRDRFVSMQQAERKAGIEERAFARILTPSRRTKNPVELRLGKGR